VTVKVVAAVVVVVVIVVVVVVVLVVFCGWRKERGGGKVVDRGRGQEITNRRRLVCLIARDDRYLNRSKASKVAQRETERAQSQERDNRRLIPAHSDMIPKPEEADREDEERREEE